MKITRKDYQLNRSNFLKQLVNLKKSEGLEIGACDLPTVSTELGKCEFADFRSSQEMINLWNLPSETVVPVKYILKRNTKIHLQIDRKFDYVILCHVIEHIPNPIGYIKDLHNLLKDGGVIIIACPDKRRTSDSSRPSTTIDHLLQDYYDDCNYPSLEHILEFGRAGSEEVRQKSIESTQAFYEWGRNYFESGYADVHCHVWTDEEFFTQIEYLIDGKILDGLKIIDKFYNNSLYNEFLIALQDVKALEMEQITTTRLEKILSCIDVSTQAGLEIGPLINPIVTHEMGNVCYVDLATTEELKLKYADDPNVDINKIVEVDYVWGKNKLPDLVGKDAPFDYMIASHVIEHVPDFIGWLKEIHAVLKPGGILSLVIPDKRYCFDYYRQLTTTAEVLDAFLRQSRKPSPKQVFDSLALFASCNGKIAWDCLEDTENAKFEFKHSEVDVWEAVRSSFLNDSYIDSHCWVFTPKSFFKLLKSLINLDLFDFKVERFYPTNGCEFYVSLKSLNRASTSVSERRATQLKSIDVKALGTEQITYSRQPEQIELELQQAQAKIAAMESSKFWKLRNQWFKLKKMLGLKTNN